VEVHFKSRKIDASERKREDEEGCCCRAPGDVWCIGDVVIEERACHGTSWQQRAHRQRHDRPRVETVETWKIEFGKADQNPINTRQDRAV
jgi:hypothetical protein